MPESGVAGLFRVRLEYTGFSNVSGSLFNVLHYLDTATPQHDYTNSQVAGFLATAVKSFWETVGTGGGAALRTLYDAGAPTTVYVKNLNKDEIEASAPTTALGGSATGSQLPAEVAVCCTLGTPLGGKSYRGRMYLPPPEQGANLVGVISSSFVTAAKASIDTWLRASAGNVLQVNDLDLCVYSRKLDVATLVTSTRLNNTWDTQRGRGLR